MELLIKHKPKVLWGAPTCAPWSQANTTMNPELKQFIREKEIATFEFFSTACQLQHSQGRFWTFEQPRGSALNKQDEVIDLKRKCGAHSAVLCMCMHGLKDPDNGKLHRKATVLEGTVVWTERTIVSCSKNHEHSPINGRNSSGKLKSSMAQTYAPAFCRNVAKDLKLFLQNTLAEPRYKYYPANAEDEDESEEEATQDPYGAELLRGNSWVPTPNQAPPKQSALPVPIPTEKQKFVEPTAKRMPREKSNPSSSSKDLPPSEEPQEGDSDEEFQKVIESGIQTADRLLAEEEARKTEEAKPEEPSDLVAEEPEESVTELEVIRSKPLSETAIKGLEVLKDTYGRRVSTGGVATFQHGQSLRLVQELFGSPYNVTIKLAIMAKHPGETSTPEPLVARDKVPLLKELIYIKKAWTQTNWKPFAMSRYPTRKKPLWILFLYGHKTAEELALKNPWEELADMQQSALTPLKSLPAFLDRIVNGSAEEKTMLILQLHKKLYHMRAEELRKALHKAGIPWSILTFVEDAVAACQTCRSFASATSKPKVKISLAIRFNHTIYCDLVFFDKCVIFIAVDEAIRWTRLSVVEYKDYD